jgi:hypothetical protein
MINWASRCSLENTADALFEALWQGKHILFRIGLTAQIGGTLMPLKCWQASRPNFIMSLSFEVYRGMMQAIQIVTDKARRGQSSTLWDDTDSIPCVGNSSMR